MKKLFSIVMLALVVAALAPAAERWVYVDQTAGSEHENVYIDSQTLSYRTDAKGVRYCAAWVKYVEQNGTVGLVRNEFTSSHYIRALSFVLYNADGSVRTSSDTATSWSQVIPGSMGEELMTFLLARPGEGGTTL